MNLLDAPVDQGNSNERDEFTAKWKDKPHDELLKAKVDSDIYIKTLERQKDELRNDYIAQREELLAKAKFEDLVDRLQNPDRQVTPPIVNDTEKPPMDLKEIEAMVLNKIKENKLTEKQNDNFTQVQNKLQERFGTTYHGVLKEQQNTLGLTDDDVNALAKKSPEAFFRIMGLNEQPRTESFQTPPRSAQRADSFAPKGQTKRDWNYYQELKKAQPLIYLDPKISVQMHNDAVAQGEAFYG